MTSTFGNKQPKMFASDYIKNKRIKTQFCNYLTCPRNYSLYSSGNLMDYNKFFNNKNNLFKHYNTSNLNTYDYDISDYDTYDLNTYDTYDLDSSDLNTSDLDTSEYDTSDLNASKNANKLKLNNVNVEKENKQFLRSNKILSYNPIFSNKYNFPYYIDEDPNILYDESILIAYFSNVQEKKECKEYNIRFKTIYLDYNYFKKLFYDSYLGNFHIAEINKTNTVLLLNTQIYSGVPFVLYSTLLKAYEELYFKSRNTLSTEKLMLLNKEVLTLVSILDFSQKQITLNWKEDVIPSLINKVIVSSNSDSDSAYVTFTINISYYCEILDLNLSMNVYYKTKLPGYLNIYNGGENINVNNVFSSVISNKKSPHKITIPKKKNSGRNYILYKKR
jgi:hypothetical protein